VRSLLLSDLFLFSLWNLCSPEGRGYPDIAARAEKFAVINNNIVDSVDGTGSAASVCPSLLSAPPLCVVHYQATS
jgi:hypothetical protein